MYGSDDVEDPMGDAQRGIGEPVDGSRDIKDAAEDTEEDVGDKVDTAQTDMRWSDSLLLTDIMSTDPQHLSEKEGLRMRFWGRLLEENLL